MTRGMATLHFVAHEASIVALDHPLRPRLLVAEFCLFANTKCRRELLCKTWDRIENYVEAVRSACHEPVH
jgi:hypothetical protein